MEEMGTRRKDRRRGKKERGVVRVVVKWVKEERARRWIWNQSMRLYTRQIGPLGAISQSSSERLGVCPVSREETGMCWHLSITGERFEGTSSTLPWLQRRIIF
jgi:hypothetical protein